MWLQKMRSGVEHLAYSLDGRFLYTLDTSGSLTVWDVASHSSLRLPTEHLFRDQFARGMYPLADGQLLIRTDQFTLLNKAGALLLRSNPRGFSEHGFAQVRNDGQIHYVGPTRRTIIAASLGASAPKTVFTLPESFDPYEQFNRFDWSQTGKSLAVLLTGSVDAAVFETVVENEPHAVTHVPDLSRTYRIKFFPDASTLAIFSESPDRFSLWDVAARSMRVTGIELSMKRGVFAFNPVYPVFAARQRNGMLAIWSTENGQPIRSLDFALGKNIRDVAFSPDGLTCAVGGSNKQFVVFDVDV